MRLKLPLLMASSLLWQAAAWGDEWVDYATAVTVTDGYLCSGELYGDSTGTDIKCDMGNPFVDGDGNVGIGTASPGNSLTVVGDASVTTLNAVQLCDETGANCTDLSGGLSGVSSLASLTDVDITSPVSGSILTYNGSSGEWVNVASTSNTALVAFRVDDHVGGSNKTVTGVYIPSRKHFDTGNSFDLATGKFTAPVDGYYHFSWTAFAGSTSGRTFLKKNGANLAQTNGNGKGISITLKLIMGDEVWLAGSATFPMQYYSISGHNAFSGFLLSGGGVSIGAPTLNDLTDVNAASPDEGQVLSWDDGNSEWVAADGPHTLSDTDGDTKINLENAGDTDTISFTTAGVERMVIAANGHVGIGTSSPAKPLHIADSSSDPVRITNTSDGNWNRIQFNKPSRVWSVGQDNSTGFIICDETDAQCRVYINSNGYVGIGTGAQAYKLHVNGTAYATGAAGALSDRRHKKKIVTISESALDKILQLRPVTFEWNEPKDDGMLGRQYGFIAQEVEKIIPEIVLTQDDKDKTKGLKPTAFIPWLVKSDQELKLAQDAQTARLLNSEKKIESLEAEIAHLKSQINLILSLQPESALAH